MKVALVIADHPDDEVLGCGTTIARLADEGWAAHVVIVSVGSTSRSTVRDPAMHEQELFELAKFAKVANGILGGILNTAFVTGQSYVWNGIA